MHASQPPIHQSNKKKCNKNHLLWTFKNEKRPFRLVFAKPIGRNKLEIENGQPISQLWPIRPLGGGPRHPWHSKQHTRKERQEGYKNAQCVLLLDGDNVIESSLEDLDLDLEDSSLEEWHTLDSFIERLRLDRYDAIDPR